MKFKNIPKWILTHLSVLTMVLMPVAQGQAAEKQKEEISKAMVQNAIVEMGLNKSMTYGEFYKKNKDKYPPRLQKELAPYFAQFADSPMPQFDVGTAQGSDGKSYPTIRISQNGQLHNVQLFGETERYAKFNNTNLTEVDLINFDDALVRLAAGDEKLRQQLANTSSKVPNKSVQEAAAGFPEITKDSWAKLTPEQRAGYVISMRLLYNDAHGVLLASKTKKNKKPKKFSFFESMMGQEAFAVDKLGVADNEFVPNGGAGAGDPTVQSRSNNYGLDSCLVAGYVTKYEGNVCKYNEMVKNYTDVNSLAHKAYVACGSGKEIACNPLVFGAPGGKAICISRSNNDDVQRATHYEGPCERNNHTNTKISFLGSENIKKGRYDSSNVKKSTDEIKGEAKREQEAEMYKATKDYIAGVLAFKDPTLHKLFIDKTPDEKTIAALVQIKDNFNDEIRDATAACKAASSNRKTHEKNFWAACDQLQRRFIFVAEYLNKNPGCKDNKPVNETTLKCSCDDGTSVLPGVECKKPTPPVDVVPPGPVTGDDNPDDSPKKCDPACSKDQRCDLQDLDWKCIDKDPKKKKGGFGRFLLKALPWVVGAGALVGMYFLFKPKKVKLNPAGDICPDGTNAPCRTICESPKVNSNGACVCPACPPGKTIINANTCDCGSQGNDVKLVCPDGVTIVDKYEDCPKALYTCWDGSQVTNAINCPEKPAKKSDGKTKTTR